MNRFTPRLTMTDSRIVQRNAYFCIAGVVFMFTGLAIVSLVLAIGGVHG